MGLAIKIENMTHEAEVLRSLSLATYDAIYNGSDGYEEFDGAFRAAFCMAHDHMKSIKAMSDEALIFVDWAVRGLKEMTVEEVRERYCEVVEVFCKEESIGLEALEIVRHLINFVIADKEKEIILNT